jgi:ABC-2 type transport system ATP-binding protein
MVMIAALEKITPKDVNLAEAYYEKILSSIKDSQFPDALNNLIDFSKNYQLDEEEVTIVQYYSRYQRIKTNKRNGANAEDIENQLNDLVRKILDMSRDMRDSVNRRINSTTVPFRLADDNANEIPIVQSDDLETGFNSLVEPISKVHRARTIGRIDEIKEKIFSDTPRQKVASCVQIRKSYAKGNFSLSPISFDLSAGEITAVVGMNASGKTTILKMLMGQLLPDAGTVTYPLFCANKTDWRLVKNRIAFVSQMPDRWNGSIRLNLNYVASTFGASGEKNEELVTRYVSRYGLFDHQNRTWDELSGGYRIRFELVKALLSNPGLLILDEPLAYLDVVTQQIFLDDVRSIASNLSNPIPVIITSQHLYEVEAISNNIIVVRHGNCIYAGQIDGLPPDEKLTFILDTEMDRVQFETALKGMGHFEVESVMGGYIVEFAKDGPISNVMSTLVQRIGDDLISVRNISNSTRRLFRNRPGDIESQWGS